MATAPTLRIIDETLNVTAALDKTYTPNTGTAFLPMSVKLTATNPAGAGPVLKVSMSVTDGASGDTWTSAGSAANAGTTQIYHLDWAAAIANADPAWAVSETAKNWYDLFTNGSAVGTFQYATALRFLPAFNGEGLAGATLRVQFIGYEV